MSLCVGGHSPCSGQAAGSLGALSPGAARPLPPRRAAWAARGLRALPSPSVAPARRRSGLRKSLQIGTRACLPGGRGGFSGAEFAPCPSPCLLSPAGMGRLFSGVSQPLVLRTAGGVFQPVNFSALPQFKKSLPPTFDF